MSLAFDAGYDRDGVRAADLYKLLDADVEAFGDLQDGNVALTEERQMGVLIAARGYLLDRREERGLVVPELGFDAPLHSGTRAERCLFSCTAWAKASELVVLILRSAIRL